MKNLLSNIEKVFTNLITRISGKLDTFMQLVNIKIWYLSCRIELMKLNMADSDEEINLLKELEQDLKSPIIRDIFHAKGKVTLIKTLRRDKINFINQDLQYLIEAEVLSPDSDATALKCNITIHMF